PLRPPPQERGRIGRFALTPPLPPRPQSPPATRAPAPRDHPRSGCHAGGAARACPRRRPRYAGWRRGAAMTKRPVALLRAAALLLSLLAAYLASRPAAGIQAAFDRIEVGMPEAEVGALIGCPATSRVDFDPSRPSGLGAHIGSSQLWHTGRGHVTVHFDKDGKVAGKEMFRVTE